jgi:hypothetical protein
VAQELARGAIKNSAREGLLKTPNAVATGWLAVTQLLTRTAQVKATVGDAFGRKYVNVNYGLMCPAKGVAALLVPVCCRRPAEFKARALSEQRDFHPRDRDSEALSTL